MQAGRQADWQASIQEGSQVGRQEGTQAGRLAGRQAILVISDLLTICKYPYEKTLLLIGIIFDAAMQSVHRMLRVLLLLLLLLLLLRHVFTSSQSQICLSVRFGFV